MTGPRWQQARAAYPLFEAVGEIGIARVWWNEGASPGWGWHVVADGGGVVRGGMFPSRDDAERAALACVGGADADTV